MLAGRRDPFQPSGSVRRFRVVFGSRIPPGPHKAAVYYWQLASMTLALVVVASRYTSLLLASPRCRWLVGHPRSVRGKYTRRTPINNLKRARNDLEYGRCVTDELAIRLDADRLLAVDLDPAGPAEFNLGQPAMRSSVKQREAADAERPTDVTDRDDVEAPIIELSLGRNPHPPAEAGPSGRAH